MKQFLGAFIATDANRLIRFLLVGNESSNCKFMNFASDSFSFFEKKQSSNFFSKKLKESEAKFMNLQFDDSI
jgi:hypothetical protein